MSTFLVHPNHIGAVASCTGVRVGGELRNDLNIDDIVHMLAKANLDSIAARYPSETYSDADLDSFVADCSSSAKSANTLCAGSIFNMASCLAYQCCEVDDWHTSDARGLIDLIRIHAGRALASAQVAARGGVTWEYTGV